MSKKMFKKLSISFSIQAIIDEVINTVASEWETDQRE